ncbi:MAG: hypothetical protein IKN45_01040 [Lachnospiraceae bacterium]|nr:hypothetical protein [Lachnospiraceae bacterium]
MKQTGKVGEQGYEANRKDGLQGYDVIREPENRDNMCNRQSRRKEKI